MPKLLPPDPTPAHDMLLGARAIGDFLLPDADPRRRARQVYHFAESMKGTRRPPIWRLGSMLCARKSALVAWIAEQERASNVA